MHFIDLAAQQARIKDKLDQRIAAVLAHGGYIMGPEVTELETTLGTFSGAKHCLSCANGTDALLLALMVLNVRTGDAVFCPSFTFAATAEVIPSLGATPVFCDIDPLSYNMDAASLERAIDAAKTQGLRPAAVIAVDLFGLPADYNALEPLAEAYGMTIISDSAQGFGSRYHNRRSGTFAPLTTTSFFPAKPLGCYGDGGAVFTDNDDWATLIQSYRVHGKGSHKYDNERIGMNSRLDTLQAAILLEKFAIFEDELEQRQTIAQRYTEALAETYIIPALPAHSLSAWAQYTLRPKQRDRAQVMASLKEQGIPTAVYYPRPLHQQMAYAAYPIDPNGLPVSEQLAQEVFSVPMHPYLSIEDQDRVIAALIAAQ